MRVVEALLEQAASCRALGSPMYASLLGHLADDAGRGGATWGLLADHDDDPGPSALGLRLLGSLHRLVLQGRASSLAPFFPSVGGTWEPEGGATAVVTYLAKHPDAVAEWLDRAPQTNEVGRSAALAGGLLQLDGQDGHLAPGLPVRLRELGSSAGLNLRIDGFGYTDDRGATFGDVSSPVILEAAWSGRVLTGPLPLVVDRVGCDPYPVDPTTPEGQLTLTAYTWPDQAERLGRLRAAFRIAAALPVELRRQGAAEFVDDLSLREGTVTVVWHSVMWQYLSSADRNRIGARLDELGSEATPSRALAHLRLEPVRRHPGAPHEFLVLLRTWPGGPERVLGRAAPHGLPVTWEGAAVEGTGRDG